jgi:hypothetical protein
MISTCSLTGLFSAAAAPVGTPWMWTLAFGHHEDRTPTDGLKCFQPAGKYPHAPNNALACFPSASRPLETGKQPASVVASFHKYDRMKSPADAIARRAGSNCAAHRCQA